MINTSVRSIRDAWMRERQRRESVKPNLPRQVAEVITQAAAEAGVAPATVLLRCNERAPVAARRAAIHALHAMGFSSTQIGRWLGGLHHTTVLHHLRSAPPAPRVQAYDASQPDMSGEWAI